MANEITSKSEIAKPAETAIKVENISKTFRIPHEKISTIRGAFVNLFRSNGYEEFKALDDVSFEVKKGHRLQSGTLGTGQRLSQRRGAGAHSQANRREIRRHRGIFGTPPLH
jgi:hypothetical protein